MLLEPLVEWHEQERSLGLAPNGSVVTHGHSRAARRYRSAGRPQTLVRAPPTNASCRKPEFPSFKEVSWSAVERLTQSPDDPHRRIVVATLHSVEG